jgi:ABC-2 type transport system permease protein
MNKVWIIASNVFRTKIRARSFLILTLAFPLIFGVIGLVSWLVFRETADDLSLGFVDETGRLAVLAQIGPGEHFSQLVQFENIEESRSALEAGQIDGFLLIPGDYFDGGRVQYHAEAAPVGGLQSELARAMRRAIYPEAPPEVIQRITESPDVTYVSLEDGSTITSGVGLVVYFFAPWFLALIFALTVLFSTGQMGTAVVREKEQRAMEMIITSVRPSELIAGNVLGLVMLALLQFSVWILSGIFAILFIFNIEVGLADLVIPWQVLVWAVLLMVPGFLLYAILGAGVGVLTGNHQQSDSVAGIIGLLAFVPIWFSAFLITNPDSMLVVGLGLFPLTATTVSLLRIASTEVPFWQLATSVSLLVLTLLLATWFVARVFRTAMLMYGQVVKPKHLWQALQGK